MKNIVSVSYLVFVTLFLITCNQQPGYQGQGPTQVVSTKTKPVQKQWKGTWAFQDSTIFFTNNFDGARLNAVAQTGAREYTIWITAENTPINPSPWYAFKVWSNEPASIDVLLTYQDSRNRYYPKISRDGINFSPLDSGLFEPINPGEGEFGINAVPESARLTLKIDNQPTWVSAQELWDSKRVYSWMDSTAKLKSYPQSIVGRSRENREIKMLEIGNPDAERAIIVISRQHPPEVTGFLAMKAFVERLTSEDESTEKFRTNFVTYVVPLMNPDGVDNGHWRHNMGGIDLNRDWKDFNQPETTAIRDFLNSKSESGKDFVFGVDFHSTWDDIYYPLDTVVTTNEDEAIIYDWIQGITSRLPQKETNVSASLSVEPTLVSRNYFYKNHNMPAIVFELGDNTPRAFLKEKGEVAAEELMKLLDRYHK